MPRKNKNKSQDENLKATLKKNSNEVLFVMLSTMNQMVNYIPLKYFQFKNVLNITTDAKSNEIWDENFKNATSIDVVTDKNKKEVSSGTLLNIQNLKETLQEVVNNRKESTVFWNITGGQRPLILAIYDLVREDKTNRTHYLCYLEGNSGEMKIMCFTESNQKQIKPVKYAIEGLTIDTAFKLMRFKESENSPKYNFLETHDTETLKFYINEFFPKFEKHLGLRKLLRELNQNVSELNKLNYIDAKAENKEKRKAHFNKVIEKIAQDYQLNKDSLVEHWGIYNTRKAYGYILEDLAAYLIINTLKKEGLKDKVADIRTSAKAKKAQNNNQGIVDEFDILLLTKTGQLFNFECKSGGMSGDNAKSNKYSTYAIGGVYGLPILIIPATANDVKQGEMGKATEKAYNAAERANLKQWKIDKIEENLKNLLK